MYWRYGVFCAPAGFLVGIYIAITAIGSGYEVFMVGAPIAAFLCGALFWRILMVEATYSRAVFTGVFAGIVSHWVCWYLLFSVSYLHDLFTAGINPDRIDPVTAVAASVAYSLFSLLVFGWFTVGFAVILALVMTWNIKRKLQSPQALSDQVKIQS